VTVKEAANAFLNAKQALVDAGELSPWTWSAKGARRRKGKAAGTGAGPA
jgi:hypothetical protein